MKSLRLPVLSAALLLTVGAAWAIGEPEETIRSRIERKPVVSSNVAAIGYSRKLHALEIEFTRGAIYRFLDVQPRVYRSLMAAESKGHFIAANIRGQYRFVRVRPSGGESRLNDARLTKEAATGPKME